METRDEIKQRIKERLHSYIARNREREQLEQELQTLESSMTSPRIQAMDGMPRGSGGGDPIAGLMVKFIELQEQYKYKLQQLVEAQTEVEELIKDLEPTERTLLRFRYIEGLVWEEVCVRMGYSWRQTHRLHSKTLDKLVDKKLEEMGNGTGLV